MKVDLKGNPVETMPNCIQLGHNLELVLDREGESIILQDVGQEFEMSFDELKSIKQAFELACNLGWDKIKPVLYEEDEV